MTHPHSFTHTITHITHHHSLHTITHFLRLVTAHHINQNKDYEKLLAEQAKSHFKETEIGVRTGNKMFSDSVERYRDRKRSNRSASIVSISATSRTGSGDEEERTQDVVKDGTVSEFTECVPGPSTENTSPSPILTPVLTKSYKKTNREFIMSSL